MKDVQGVPYTDVSSKKQTETQTIDSQFAANPTKKRMKVLVVNAYVREEAGDAALLSVLLDQIAAAFPGSELCVSGMESPLRFADFEGKRNIGSIRRWTSDEEISRPSRLVRKMVSGLIAFFWFRGPTEMWHWVERCLPREPRSELIALRTADLVIGVGGGYLQGKRSIGGNLNVFYLVLPLMLTKRLKKPLVLAPQSYGPFGSEWQKKAVVRVLRDIEAVFVREDISMTLLASLGAKPRQLERAVDSGFAFEGCLTRDWRTALSIDGAIPLVGMTARQWLEPTTLSNFIRHSFLSGQMAQSPDTIVSV